MCKGVGGGNSGGGGGSNSSSRSDNCGPSNNNNQSRNDCGRSESRSDRGGGNGGGSSWGRSGDSGGSDKGFDHLVRNSFCGTPDRKPRSPMPTIPHFPPDSGPDCQLPWKPPINCWPPQKPPVDSQPIPPWQSPPIIGPNPPWCPKPEAQVYKDYSSCPPKTVVDAGAGDDNIRVSNDPNQKGGVIVDVNGQQYHLSAEEARNLEIRGGKGNDTIIVDPDVKVGNWFDRLTNRGITLDGGDGDDILIGGSGNDTIRGGRGNDIILGGDGNDRINGGDGNDIIMDWSGNNRMRGGRGQDMVIGGQDLDWSEWPIIFQPLRA